MENDIFNPFSRPLYLVAKPASGMCNLHCEYCYYLEKNDYYPAARRIMDDRTLEKFIAGYIAGQNSPDVLFNWHGGEALLCGLDFFKRALEYQQVHGRGHRIINTIQTNGTLLDDAWCEFFHRYGFLVGISLDGPRESHDRYRKTIGGQGTFETVMRGIELLQQHRVEFNILCAVNDYNARRPLETYTFFRGTGARFIQFTPVVERTTPDGHLMTGGGIQGITSWSVTPRDWGQFLTEIFFHWVKNDVGDIFVNLFDATLAGYVGADPGNCYFAKKCGHALALEYNGDVYACDHFVFPEYLRGNILNRTLREITESLDQKAFGEAKSASLPPDCRQCRYLPLCNGECPKNRLIPSAENGKFFNYLCRGYKYFFSRTEPYFRFMASELAAGRNVLAVKSLHF